MTEPEQMSAASSSPWTPFAHREFSVLWLAVVISSTGTWMNDVGSGWLMATLAPSPLMVALVQAATTAPVFLFALTAGAIADNVDRRKLLIVVASLMALTAALLALLVGLGRIDSRLLLVFAFLLGTGAAFMAPAWQAIVPQLVTRDKLGAAIALNSVGMNLSRAIGPTLAGLLIVAVGIAAPFALNAVGLTVIVAALAWWRPAAAPVSALPTERIGGAILTGLRYTLHSGPLRATLLRTVAFVLFASAYWALLPVIAKTTLRGDARLYGVLLGCVGVGAVIGALLLPRLRQRLGADLIVAAGTLGTALVLAAFALLTHPYAAAAAAVFAGLSWIAILSSLNLSTQMALPDWVRARGVSVFLTAFFGSMALGAVIWGNVATRFGIPTALLLAAAGALLSIPLTWRAKLGQHEAQDLAPSLHWPAPMILLDVPHDRGPVMITIEYRIDRADAEVFLSLICELAQARRRMGAVQWGIMEDAARPGWYVEYFFEASWLAHLRHHERVAGADRLLQERIHALHRGETPPAVRHLLAPRCERSRPAPRGASVRSNE